MATPMGRCGRQLRHPVQHLEQGAAGDVARTTAPIAHRIHQGRLVAAAPPWSLTLSRAWTSDRAGTSSPDHGKRKSSEWRFQGCLAARRPSSRRSSFSPRTLLSALSSAISCRCLASLAFISALSSSIRLPCALTSAQTMASPAPITPGWSHSLSAGGMAGMGKEWESS